MNKIYFLPLGLIIVIEFFSIKNYAQTGNLPGTALRFRDAGQYVSGTGINPGITAITLEAWVYHNAMPNQVERYITIGPEVAVLRHDGSNSGGAGQLHFYIKKSNGVLVSLRVNGVLSTGIWTHVAGTYDGTTMKLYLNGSLIASSAPAGGLFPPDGTFDFSNNTEFLDGKLDELRVWNYVRTEQQIRENMHLTLSGSEPGLLNYWQLNEGSGATAHDYVGNCSGTLHNLGNGNWVNSTIPMGCGISNSQTVYSTGSVIFTGTGFSSNFTALSSSENVTVSRINLSPNSKPPDSFYSNCSQYWVVRNYNNQTLTTDLTFTLADDLNSYNGLNPGSVKLFTRAANSDGVWSLVKSASSVDTVANSATFSGVSAFGQFLVLRSYPENYAGNALEFDGVDDYVQLSDVSGFQYSGSFTVEAWVKPGVMGTGFHSIAAKGTEWELKIYEGPSFIIIEFGVNSNAIFSYKNLSTASVVGKWMHLCGVVNQEEGQKKLTLYVNGEAGSSETPPAITLTSSPIRIGSGFKGKIDEVRIWREARTQQQIREKMHLTPTGADKNLDVCLQFNQSSGTTVPDVAGGNDGTLTNMSLGCWVLSGVPAGGGVSNTQTETGGTVDFAGTGLTMFFNSQAGASITVSRIDTAPNINSSLFDKQYWFINRYGTGTFNANLTFTVAEDITAQDQTSSTRIKLYSRPTNDDNNWIYAQNAVSADGSGNTATFNNLTGFSQLAVCRRLPPDNFAGNALSFHHASDYVSGTGLKNTMLQFTMEAWVYHNNLSSGVQQYITLGPNVACIRYNGLSGGGDTWLNLYITTNEYSGYAVTAVNGLSTGKWMHIAGSYDGTTLNLYLNGELVQSMATSGRLDTLDGTFTISGSEAMDGKLDEIRIWNYARSIDEIRTDMYHTLSGTETGLVSYWQFNEGSGTTVTDIIGGNSGTFHNMDASHWTVSTAPVPYQSIANGNWSAGSTWNEGQDVPVKDWSRVQIKNAVVLDAHKTLIDLTVDAAASLVVASASNLTVNGTINNNAGTGGLIIQSNVAGTGSLIANTNVSATVERYLTGGANWHLISTPVSGQSIPAFVTATTALAINADGIRYGLAPFDNSYPKWVPYTTSTVGAAGNFIPAKGYEILLTSNATTSFAGTLVTTPQSIALTRPGADVTAWNLIGNPYTSAINANLANDFLTTNASQLDAAHVAVYIWNGSPPYTIINNTSSPSYIPLGQGFFVKSAPGGGIVNFTTTMRVHNSASFSKSVQPNWSKISLKANIAGKERNTDIFFIDGTTTGLDPGYDAGIFDGSGSDNTIFTHIDGFEVGFAIQSLPNNLNKDFTIPLGLNAPQGATITFTSELMNSPFELKVYLQDVATGRYTRIDIPGSSYQVTLGAASSGIGRFFLITSTDAMGISENKDEQYSVIATPSENIIRLSGPFEKDSQVCIFSTNGQLVYSGKLSNPGETEIRFAPAVSGMYILRLQSGRDIINKKINWIY